MTTMTSTPVSSPGGSCPLRSSQNSTITRRLPKMFPASACRSVSALAATALSAASEPSAAGGSASRLILCGIPSPASQAETFSRVLAASACTSAACLARQACSRLACCAA